ncbi:MAG: FAD:protein FMN transferase [Gammaproteobacteria bacterium]
MPSPSQATESGGVAALHGPPAQLLPSVRRARPILGTMVGISVYDQLAELKLHAAIDAAFACIERVHALMSFHLPDSELSRLNRDAVRRAQQVDPHTYAVFDAALRMAASSGGAFDPCIAPRLEEWGLLPHSAVPVDPSGNWRDIELLPGRRIRYSRPVRVDLGGIAKGYAVDLAVRSIQRYGVENIVVNAGGDLRVVGSHTQSVRLRCPSSPLYSAHAVDLCNAALATSADYFSRRASATDGVSALVNPRDNTPYLGGRSVSVRAEDCMTADALTKVVMFAPTAIAETVLADYRAEAFYI